MFYEMWTTCLYPNQVFTSGSGKSLGPPRCGVQKSKRPRTMTCRMAPNYCQLAYYILFTAAELFRTESDFNRNP
jgi:hypothetical protein